MARLVFDNMEGEVEEVTVDARNPVVTVGRSSECTIRPNRKSVSRKHAEFRCLGNDGFEVIDLNSSNGVFIIINGERQRVEGREYLTDGDEIWFGDFIIHFYDDNEAASFDKISDAYMSSNSGAFSPHTVNRVVDESHPNAATLLKEKREIETALAKQSMEVIEQSSEIKQLKFQIAALQHQIEMMKEDTGALVPNSPEAVRAILAERDALKQEIASLRVECNRQIKRARSEEEVALELRKQLEQSRLAEVRLTAQLDAVEEKPENRAKIASGSDPRDAEIAAYKEEINNLNRVIQRLRERLDLLEDKDHSLNPADEELLSLRNRFESLKSEYEKVSKKLFEEKALSASNSSRIKTLERENQESEANRGTLVEELEQAKSEAKDLESQLLELRKSHLHVLEELKSVQAQLKSEETKSGAGILRATVLGNQQKTSEEDNTEADEKKERKESLISDELLKKAEEATARLELVVDAFNRTDLSPLSTIDRVRLQGSMNELDPKVSFETVKSVISNLISEKSD